MTQAGERLIAGAQEALVIAKGEQPAASITIAGHRYVHLPKGARVVPPGALDAETVERCAKIADDEDGVFTDYGMDRNNSVAQRTSSRIAAAIRSLSPKDKP